MFQSNQSNLELLIDDLFIRVCGFLNHNDVMNLASTSTIIKNRLLDFVDTSNCFLLLISLLNENLSTKAEFLTKLESYDPKEQLPKIGSFLLMNCCCLIVCKFTKQSHIFDCFRIPHPKCCGFDHSDVHVSPVHCKQIPMKVSISKNSIIFLGIHKYQLICYEFDGYNFICRHNDLKNEATQRFQYHQKQFRIVEEDGCHIYTLDCEHLQSFSNLVKEFIICGIGYYGIRYHVSYPLHYVTWGTFFDFYRFWIADLKKQKFYSFESSFKLNRITSYHITNDDQVIMIPELMGSNHIYHLYKYDLIDNSIWIMNIDFSDFTIFHKNLQNFKRVYFCLLFLTDNFVNVTKESISFEHLFWLNLDSYSWIRVTDRSIIKSFKCVEVKLMFVD